MPRLTAGAEIAHPSRAEGHAAAFATTATAAGELVARLRKGRELLARMDGACAYRAEAEGLWSALVMDLYTALRDAYARYALVRAMAEDEGEALALWDRLMPAVDDMHALGVPALFDHFRGRIDRPEWITDAECRCVTQMIWPPRPGEDVFDTGVREMYAPIPF